MPRFTVPHFVLASVVRRHPASSAWDLLGAGYNVAVVADVEFPKRVGPFELFTRFVVRRQSLVRVVVVVTHDDAPDGPRRVYRRLHDVICGQPAAPASVVDTGLKLVNLELVGTGRYTVRLYGPRPAAWLRRPILAAEYYSARRAA